MKTLKILIGITGLMLVLFSARSQNLFVEGIVTDENNQPIAGVNVVEKSTTNGVVTDVSGFYRIKVKSENAVLVFTFIGYVSEEINIQGKNKINIQLTQDITALEEVVVVGYGSVKKSELTGAISTVPSVMVRGMSTTRSRGNKRRTNDKYVSFEVNDAFNIPHNTEGYSTIHENGFREVKLNPLSTFSIDVDAASYSNIRRYLNQGTLPPKDAVRIEEMVNYFSYDYDQPKGEDPFSIHTELTTCPWNDDNKLLLVGLQGKKIPVENLPPSNIVFLIDVSGSMNSYNKLPLLKSSFKLLVNQLRPEDRVAIVVYAGSSGLVLPSTPGNQKQTMLEAINRLSAGGSTAGGAGLKLAYKVAEENFMEEGNNRIILATDGDFNVGSSSNAEMERLIEKEREKGIFISVLGYGMGNYKDDKMEIIADKGNGNYAYIDNIQEAQKVLVNEFGGTLFTIAKDVKIQIEFNPENVESYRLIGYENRLLNEEDFDDDKKDAGELGSGHTVTALYEIKTSNKHIGSSERKLRYQETQVKETPNFSKELVNVKLRYKQPEGKTSKLLEQVVMDKTKDFNYASENLRWASAVAQFGMLLRESEFKGNTSFDDVVKLARDSKGEDEEGYRGEFVRLVKLAKTYDEGLSRK